MRPFIKRSVSLLIGIICFVGLALTTFAQAETLVESSLFFRTYVGFTVGQEAVQAWLPDPWKAVSMPKGLFKGANLYVLFEDKLLQQDGEGNPDKGGTYCSAALIVFGKNQQTGEFAPFVSRIYAPYDGPGPYKNSVKATAYREASIKGATSESGAGSEMWKVQDSAGGIMEFRMDYQRAVPKRIRKKFKVRSSVEPDIFFNNQDDYTLDVVKSIPAGIDRVKNYKFRVTMSELRKMFDGSEQLVGISINPCRVRQRFRP
ncbi:MAG: hypothetical protein PVF10_06460 [Syntrophobacterales bacterium]|jgi:hypothetical protein